MTELEQKLYERGVHADALLNDLEVQTCFAELSQGLLDALANTDPTAKDKRETYYYMHRGLQDLQALLTSLSQFKEQQDNQDETEDQFLSDDELLPDML